MEEQFPISEPQESGQEERTTVGGGPGRQDRGGSAPGGQDPGGQAPGGQAPGGSAPGGSEWAGEAYQEPSVLDNVKTWAGDLFAQASEVILRPAAFFAGLPREESLWRATTFAVVMGAVAGILGFILRVLPAFSSVFTTPFAAFAGTVVGAFVVHVLAMLAGGRGSLEHSYRLAGYLMVFLPLIVVSGVLPYLNLAMAGYGLYALIMGVIPVHELEERRAWSIFGTAGAGVLALLVFTRFADTGGGASALEELELLRMQQRRVERQIEKLQQRQQD